jgi:hypothetical protein
MFGAVGKRLADPTSDREFGAPDWERSSDLRYVAAALCRLSYWRVLPRGFEPRSVGV